MPPTISVVIPAYNRAVTIGRAINSVLAQSFQDLEIFVVDDGSTDRTCEVVQQIGDPRMRIIRGTSNQGAAEARNKGMKAATGKYIAWLDSDDEWLPDKLQIQLDTFIHAAPDQKACFTGFERIDEKFGSVIYIPKCPDRKQLFLGCNLTPTTFLFERSVLDTIGFMDTSFIRYEDWDWMLRYCAEYRLLSVEQPLARIYYSFEQPSKIVEISASRFVTKYSDDLRRFGTYRNIVISRRWMEVARYFAYDHRLRKIIQYVVKGLSVYPFQPPETWIWLINAWFGIKIGLLPSKIKALIIGGRE